MKLAIIILAIEPLPIAKRICQGLKEDSTTLFLPRTKYALIKEMSEYLSLSIVPFDTKLKGLVANIFRDYQGIIFIMPLGIVVRTIAPYLQSKYRDPAVVVMDHKGRYAISTLCGHEGGANALAYKIANLVHAEPIITTAQEARKDLIIGIGCCQGVSSQHIQEAIRTALTAVGREIGDVRALATAEIKASEEGIIQAAAELAIPLRIISHKEIEQCPRGYNKSLWVKEKIGLEGVCEPAALLAGRKTILILPKTTYQRVTLAIAQENSSW
jgi:cobalt-precorrin 5A hydrolase